MKPEKMIKLTQKIREQMDKATERLTEISKSEGFLFISDLADEVLKFYDILP